MPKTIPKGLTATHVRKALKDLDDDNKRGGFGKQKRYSVWHNGKSYAPKAVVGVAFRHLTGKILHHTEFSGGIAPGQANYVLNQLGFDVRDSHDGKAPDLDQLEKIARRLKKEGYFDVKNAKDERKRTLREIAERRGQSGFRKDLLAAYSERCAITGCDAVAALEAAHIMPYLGTKSHRVTNGLLLRADVHTLFDLDLIGIEPYSATVVLGEPLKETCCADLSGTKLTLPDDSDLHPDSEALQQRWSRFNTKD